MLPSEIMIWQPEFTDKILSRKPGAVQFALYGFLAAFRRRFSHRVRR
ncbi:PapI protein [Escherichia coli]|nr:PapI protein [Escherichia coli]